MAASGAAPADRQSRIRGACLGASQVAPLMLREAVVAAFGADGALAQADEAYVEREVQQRFALAVAACFLLFGPALIDTMTASDDIRRIARDYLPFVIFAPLLGVFAFAFDGIYIGATWARDMRNLMVLSLLIFLTAWFALRSFGNAGLWGALLVHYAARGGLEALRYPALLRNSFARPAQV